MNNICNKSISWIRPTKKKGLVLASLMAAAIALALATPVQKTFANGDSDREGNSEPITGTWLVQVSIDPASVPPGSVLQFTVVPTFDAGGGVVQGETGNGHGGMGDSLEAHGN